MKVEEIRGLKEEELLKKVEEAHQEIFNLRFRLATRQLRNHRQLRAARRELAVVKTVVRERQLGIGRG